VCYSYTIFHIQYLLVISYVEVACLTNMLVYCEPLGGAAATADTAAAASTV